MNELDYKNIIVIDLETTGLDERKDQIIQIAAVAVSTGEEFEAKIKFDYDESMDEVLGLNSYNKDLWDKEDIELKGALLLFNDFLKRNGSVERISKKGIPYKVPVFAGYNSTFDLRFLKEAYKKVGLNLFCENRSYDVMQLAMWYIPGLESYSLQNMLKTLGLESSNAHDALDDCYSTISLMKEIFSLPLRKSNVPKWARLEG